LLLRFNGKFANLPKVFDYIYFKYHRKLTDRPEGFGFFDERR